MTLVNCWVYQNPQKLYNFWTVDNLLFLNLNFIFSRHSDATLHFASPAIYLRSYWTDALHLHHFAEHYSELPKNLYIRKSCQCNLPLVWGSQSPRCWFFLVAGLARHSGNWGLRANKRIRAENIEALSQCLFWKPCTRILADAYECTVSSRLSSSHQVVSNRDAPFHLSC